MLAIVRNLSSQICCCKAFLNYFLERCEGQLSSHPLLFWHCFHKPANWAPKIWPPCGFRQICCFRICFCWQISGFQNGNGLCASLFFASEGPNCSQNLELYFFWLNLVPQFSFLIGFISSAISPPFDWVANTDSTAFFGVLTVFFGFPKCNASCRFENQWEINEWNILNLEDTG